MNSSISGLIWSLMMASNGTGGSTGGTGGGTTIIKKDEIWVGQNESELFALPDSEKAKYVLFITLDDLEIVPVEEMV